MRTVLRLARQIAEALRLFFWFRLAMVLLIFVFIFRPNWLGFDKGLFGEVDPVDVVNVIRDAFVNHPGRISMWLAFACIAKLLGITSGVIRWKLLLHGQGIKMPLLYMVYLWFMGRAIGLFLPGTLGLDGFRMVESSRYTGEWIKCTTVIVIEKIIGFIALGTILTLSFPLGMHLIGVNITQLPFILAIPAGVVVVGLLLLLNPRVIQVGMATIPTPRFIRNTVNRFGMAATAYSGSKPILLLAVFFGMLVHTGTIFMYFGCRMAVGVTEVTIQEVLFASTLIIGLSVLTPTVSGLGVRELVGKAVLGAKVGAATGIGMMHLGLWCGELVPYVLSVPLLVFGGRPSREQLEADLSELSEHVRTAPPVDLHLSQDEISFYRRKVFSILFCGLFAGAYAGALIGMGEAAWLLYRLGNFTETGMFWWGAIAYSIVFAGLGLGVAGALLFLCLLIDKFPKWAVSFGISFGVSLGIGALGLGLWRYKRDVLLEETLNKAQLLAAGQFSMGLILEGFLIAAFMAVVIGALLKQRPVLLVLAGILAYGASIGAAYTASILTTPRQQQAAFDGSRHANGPNIIFITIDALRGDYLKMFRDRPAMDNTAELAADKARPEGQQPLNPYRSASVETPALETLARDAIVFQNAFAQASWTKPSFATLFTGLYPEDHTAISKTASLPERVDTVAELLRDADYFTKGFPNNPNVHPLFNFDQGHIEYTYLEPNRIYRAPASAASLTIYEILRRGIKPKIDNLLRLKINVREAYQPAEVVTERALEWTAGRAAPKGTPFYLYLHYMDTHDPFMDPDAPKGGYARATMDKPDPELDQAMEKAYCLEIQHLDRYLGELFDGLKRQGLYDNSLIVLTSDHGEEFCDHGGWWHGQTLYDEVLHVPLIIKLPGNVHAGEQNTGIARHIDLVPTMLHFAGIEKTQAMPGQSLFDASNNVANESIQFSYAHNDFETNTIHAVRSLDTKLIESREGPKYHRGLPPVELYDMKVNPDEQWTQNLAEDPAKAALRSEYESALKLRGGTAPVEPAAAGVAEEQAPEVPEPAAPEFDSAAMREQLDALGYVGE